MSTRKRLNERLRRAQAAIARGQEIIAKAQATQREIIAQLADMPDRADADYAPKPCEDCEEAFKPTSGRQRRCPRCRQLNARETVPVVRRTCANCQHGYQFAPGEWGCAINAAMRCKPAIVSRQWLRREVMRGETA